LFLLHINDLPVNFYDAKLHLFGSDISVLISDSDTSELQMKIDSGRRIGNLVKQEQLCNKYNFVINTGKTGVMLFHNGQHIFW
jgi:hypothetical protein